MSKKPIRVLVLGVRGLPNVQGGVETHAEHLYQHLAELGCKVEILVRSPFVPKTTRWFGPIRLRRIWSPKTHGLETLIHSFLGVFVSIFLRPDILHVHAIGPAIVTPIARLFGLKVVVTHHGPDYDRDKWGNFAQLTLRAGERFGMRYANARIAISNVIRDLIAHKHSKPAELIPNGVTRPEVSYGQEEMSRHGLALHKYFLQVSRIVPEKRQLDLIEAYKNADVAGWHLVFVGRLDSSLYSAQLTEAAKYPGVVLTGFLNGGPLYDLYSGAGAFVLPSSHEGLPIVVLEAMSFGLPILASDIPANLEVGLGADSYFPTGDTIQLARALEHFARQPVDMTERQERREWVLERYDWKKIAIQTKAVYEKMLK